MEKKIKKFFYEKAPNFVLLDFIYQEFVDTDKEKIDKTLIKLISDDFLEKREIRNEKAKITRVSYKIKDEKIGDYPIQTHIKIGEFEIPRLLADDKLDAEPFNYLYKIYNSTLEHKIKELKETYDIEVKRLWGSLVSIFGIFVTIFSLITFAIKPIFYVESDKIGKIDILIQSTINILPLSLVLIIFLLILNFIFRKK